MSMLYIYNLINPTEIQTMSQSLFPSFKLDEILMPLEVQS